MKVKIVGQKDSSGDLIEFATPVDVKRFGDALRDEDGMVWAVLDEYEDWVSPLMYKLGVKNIMEIEIDD